ncbi:MAG: isoprenylcysteine carboxylmethyltransferase family protein [Anaerolineales bacterium]
MGFQLFRLLFLGWAAFELWVNLRTWSFGSANHDRLSRFVIIAAMLLSFWLALPATGWHAADLSLARPAVFYLGLFFMAAGLLLRFIAIRQLGRFFVPEVAIQPGQQLMDQGLYHYLRHPSYTGTFLTILGFGLALTNGLSLAIMLLLPGLAYAFRMQVEEAALLHAFGEDYRRYMQRTKRLIPFVY